MSKDPTKIKEADFVKFKEEIRQELKVFRESVERDLRNEIRDLRAEQRNQAQSLDFADGTITELKEKLEAEVERNTKLEKENELLRAKRLSIESKTQDLENRMVISEQYSRRANLEIQGVVNQPNENVSDILSKIGSLIHEPIQESDIELCHRVPTRKVDKTNIVVKFKSRAKRDDVLRKAKKMHLTHKDLDLNDTTDLKDETPFYVNEHLCPTLKKLLAMAVKRKYQHRSRSGHSMENVLPGRPTVALPWKL